MNTVELLRKFMSANGENIALFGDEMMVDLFVAQLMALGHITKLGHESRVLIEGIVAKIEQEHAEKHALHKTALREFLDGAESYARDNIAAGLCPVCGGKH